MNRAVELTERFFAALAARDAGALAILIGEDAVWRFPGRRGRLAGEHRGREAIFRFFLNVAQLTGGSFHTERRALVGDDRRAFVEFVGRGERGDMQMANHTCLKLVYENDQLIEATEWVWDLDHVETFWA